MSGPPPETSGGNEDTPTRMREQIEGHLSALKALVEEHNRREKVQPIRLNFTEDDFNNDRTTTGIVTGTRVSDEDLGKPFKEIANSPLSRRLLEFSAPEHKMPSHIKLYDGSSDPEDHLTRFSGAAMQGC